MGEKKLHLLFEHASGFGIFKIREFEEENMFMAEVEECIRDFSRFSAIASHVAFSPFKTAQAALVNLNSVTEGVLADDLKNFLSTLGIKNLVLGVAEPKLGAAISEVFPKIKIRIGPVINEITRGIRTHFHKMVAKRNLALDMPILDPKSSSMLIVQIT
ncbi:Nucleolar protein 56 [Folsomia candida]|uniref:Nucleolar protein 56 n=1 Tax=Folsomia candida TaxID=158441 RepID=A0A226DY28_FOLCA|nr:Nucleolar protein 56 [Folsomia candida]